MENSLAFSIPKSMVIPYAPEALNSFNVYGFEWIDNLYFLADPASFTNGNAAPYIAIAKERFLEAGWAGDGDIQLLWLPSFVFPLNFGVKPDGVILWHVKQESDGVSFMLSPIGLPFEEFQQ